MKVVLCRLTISIRRYSINSRVKHQPLRFKVSIIEDEKVFVLVFQSLDSMGLSFGEIPDIAFLGCV